MRVERSGSVVAARAQDSGAKFKLMSTGTALTLLPRKARLWCRPLSGCCPMWSLSTLPARRSCELLITSNPMRFGENCPSVRTLQTNIFST